MIGKIAGEEIRMKLTAPDARFAREQRIKQAALKLENVKNVSKFMGANRGQGDLRVLRACKYLFQKPGPPNVALGAKIRIAAGRPICFDDSIESDSSVQEITKPAYLGNVYRKVAVRYVFMAEDL
jgi:hypothetical protein